MFNLSSVVSNSRAVAFGAFAVGAIALSAPAAATPVQLFPFLPMPPAPFAQPPMQATPSIQSAPTIQAAPSQDDGAVYEMPARLRRQVVNYATREASGTIIIDTPNTYLYFV